MGKPNETRPRQARRKMAAGVVCGLVGAVGLIAAGCADSNRMVGADPLLGGPALRASATGSEELPQPPPIASAPPAPVTAAPMSTAALASGGPRTFDKDRDLRIAPNPGSTGNDAWVRQEPGAGTGGAVLREPEPMAEPLPRREALPVSNPLPPAQPRGLTLEEAQSQLKARGVLWQRLENANGEWEFSCSVRSKDNPNRLRTHKARAADPVAAIQAVLEQIDRE